MGLFSRPKCPIHRVEYSIGTNGLTEHYYCKKCLQKAQNELKEKKILEYEVENLKNRILQLENKLTN